MRSWYRVVRGIASGTLRVLLAREVRGLEHVPGTSGVIVASNHGAFWDPPVLGVCLPRELRYMARASLFRVPLFGALIRSLGAFPVRKGTADLSGLRSALGALARGEALLVFPEGGRMKDGRLHPPLPGLGLIAARARVPIVPVYVSGTDRIRSCMVRRTKVRVTVGKPLPAELWFPPGSPSTLAGRALYQAISDRVMQEIALLRQQQQEETTRSGAAPATSTSRKATSHERGGST